MRGLPREIISSVKTLKTSLAAISRGEPLHCNPMIIRDKICAVRGYFQ